MPVAYVGIDVSKAKLDAAIQIGTHPDKKSRHKIFSNCEAAIPAVVAWACGHAKCQPAELRVTMEATGVYYVTAAYGFNRAGCEVVVSNPWRSRNYAVGIGSVNKTDKCDAEALAAFGTQEQLRLWEPRPPEIVELQWILQRINRFTMDMVRETLRNENYQIGLATETVVQSINRVRAFQKSERSLLLQELEALFARQPTLSADRDLLMTIPSIGPIVASYLLCLLRGRNFPTARDAAAVAGLVPKQAASGTSTGLRPRVAKAGNRALRAMLYMSTMSMLKTPNARAFYERVRGNGARPMQARVALMRRTVQIAFGVLKHARPYREDWEDCRRAEAAGLSRDKTSDSRSNAPAEIEAMAEVRRTPSSVIWTKRSGGVPTLVKKAKVARKRKLRSIQDYESI